jgi:hypothetical protein
MNPRWHQVRGTEPNVQTFEHTACKVEVIDPAPDLADAAQQLRHAQEQIALAGQYPGRQRSGTLLKLVR